MGFEYVHEHESFQYFKACIREWMMMMPARKHIKKKGAGPLGFSVTPACYHQRSATHAPPMGPSPLNLVTATLSIFRSSGEPTRVGRVWGLFSAPSKGGPTKGISVLSQCVSPALSAIQRWPSSKARVEWSSCTLKVHPNHNLKSLSANTKYKKFIL